MSSDGNNDLDLMQAASCFTAIALGSCAEDTLAELAAAHDRTPGPWIDSLEITFTSSVHAIFHDGNPEPDHRFVMGYSLSIMRELFVGLRKSLDGSAVATTALPRRVVINPEGAITTAGHKPVEADCFDRAEPLTIIKGDPQLPPSRIAVVDRGEDAPLPLNLAKPWLAVLSLTRALAEALLELAKFHGNTDGPWLEALEQSFLQRVQDMRCEAYSDDEKRIIAGVAIDNIQTACHTTRHYMAKQ